MNKLVYVMLAILFILTFRATISDATITGTLPPSTGDWVLDDNTVVTDETLVINGSIVSQYYDLTIRNSTLLVKGNVTIINANLIIENSTLEVQGINYSIAMKVYGNVNISFSKLVLYKDANLWYGKTYILDSEVAGQYGVRINLFYKALLDIERTSFHGLGDGVAAIYIRAASTASNAIVLKNVKAYDINHTVFKIEGNGILLDNVVIHTYNVVNVSDAYGLFFNANNITMKDVTVYYNWSNYYDGTGALISMFKCNGTHNLTNIKLLAPWQNVTVDTLPHHALLITSDSTTKTYINNVYVTGTGNALSLSGGRVYITNMTAKGSLDAIDAQGTTFVEVRGCKLYSVGDISLAYNSTYRIYDCSIYAPKRLLYIDTKNVGNWSGRAFIYNLTSGLYDIVWTTTNADIYLVWNKYGWNITFYANASFNRNIEAYVTSITPSSIMVNATGNTTIFVDSVPERNIVYITVDAPAGSTTTTIVKSKKPVTVLITGNGTWSYNGTHLILTAYHQSPVVFQVVYNWPKPLVTTTEINNTTWVVVYTVDPWVYNMLFFFALVATLLGLVMRAAFPNIMAMLLCIIVAIVTTAPYSIDNTTFIFYAGNITLMYLMISLAIVNFMVFVAKIFMQR